MTNTILVIGSTGKTGQRVASTEQRGNTPRADGSGSAATSSVGVILNNLPSYVSFGLAWLFGYGVFALAYGDHPRLPIPSAVPAVLLVGGLLTAVTITGVVTAKAQRGARGDEALVGNLLAASWPVGFVALFLIITALTTALQEQHVHTLLWPSGSGLAVGLLYLAGGVADRDVLQYALGAWLAVISSAALFLEGANLYWALALVGGGAYLVAAALEPRRYAARGRSSAGCLVARCARAPRATHPGDAGPAASRRVVREVPTERRTVV